MQRLEVSGAVRPIYGSLGVKRLIPHTKGRIQEKDFGNRFLRDLAGPQREEVRGS